jgi:hypothetical protein
MAKGKKYYYIRNGSKKVTGWAKIDGNIYYFRKDGSMYAGWLDFASKSYYFNPSAKTYPMVTGLRKINGNLYYFSDKGTAQKGLFTVKNGSRTVTYYAKSNYVLITNQWFVYRKRLMYANSEGKITQKLSTDSITSQSYNKIFMVGDSRFNRTNDYGIGTTNTVFICKSGQGYNWLTETAYNELVSQVKKAHKAAPEKRNAIVMNLGVNDLSNQNKYIQFVKNKLVPLSEKYACDLYYVSINPVSESKFNPSGKNVKSKKMSDILQFNKVLKSRLPDSVTYIDTCSYLMKRYSFEEMTIEDGVHYDATISGIIFDQIMVNIRPKESKGD